MSPDACFIELDNVRKSYDTLVAVNDISMTIERGRTIGLIGPNGAGKTTLLRMIATLAKPDQGRILINGIDVAREPRKVRNLLGFMPAEFGCPRQLTMGEYMAYFACLHGVPKEQREQCISDVFELTDLKGREDVLVSGLSTGNKQRLLLAKTLVSDPQLLILDEPASGLDPRARRELRVILKELANMGKSILVSSHILADIQDVSDYICIMEEGRLVVDGDIKELQTEYSERRAIHLSVAAERLEQATDVIGALPGVAECRIDDNRLLVVSDETNCNYVLAALIAADIEVLGLADDIPDLEEVFMRKTEGKVT
jgi:ABC-2 type transport system ATP-binding protein